MDTDTDTLRIRTTGLGTPAGQRLPSAVIEAAAVPLPFDDETAIPIPFVLTAAAQREVLGREPVPLSVVPTVAEPTDTRPVQARALLRSGMPVATIAAALGVDPETVVGWTGELADELARRRRPSVSRRTPAPVVAERTDSPIRRDREALLAGIAFALAETDDTCVTVLHDRLEPVAVLLDGLRDLVPDLCARMRIALRVGVDLQADRTRADVARRLGLDPERIIVGRGGIGSGATLEIRVDIRDVTAVGIVRSWRTGSDEGVAGLRGWDSNPQTFRLTADCSAS